MIKSQEHFHKNQTLYLFKNQTNHYGQNYNRTYIHVFKYVMHSVVAIKYKSSIFQSYI